MEDELTEVELPNVEVDEVDVDDAELELDEMLELVLVVVATPGVITMAEGLPIANKT